MCDGVNTALVIVWSYVRQTRHFGDDLPSQSLEWCKKPVSSTNRLAGILETKSNYDQVNYSTQKYKT